MSSKMPSTLRWLFRCCVLYIFLSIIAALLAIIENRPAEFGGFTTGLPAGRDFLYGNGTAMSPALYWLVILVVLILLAPRADWWGDVGVVGLSILGLLFSIGMLGEPIFWVSFNPATFNLINALIQIGMVLVPMSMMIFGILEGSRRRKEREKQEHSLS